VAPDGATPLALAALGVAVLAEAIGSRSGSDDA
jgi:hypothetical protein